MTYTGLPIGMTVYHFYPTHFYTMPIIVLFSFSKSIVAVILNPGYGKHLESIKITLMPGLEGLPT